MKLSQPLVRRMGLSTTFLALILGGSLTVLAQTEWTVHSFSGLSQGIYPMGNLVADPAGNLYGTTQEGGTSKNWGVVYELVRPVPPKTVWTETVLHNFTDGVDGGEPISGLILDEAGNLYGTTILGTSSRHGVVFELQAPSTAGGTWKEIVLHVFQPATGDGAMPVGELTRDAAGNLYGVTEYGGANQSGACFNSAQHPGCGAVFQLSPPATPGGTWTETILHSFNYGQGGWPEGGAILDAHGNLYGTTYGGGGFGAGVAYRLVPPATAGGAWAFKVLHVFHPTAEGSEGENPQGALTLHGKGILYGTTRAGGTYGGGTVFELAPPAVPGGAWTENILYSFGAESGDASSPGATVIFDGAGNVYGTTPTGGAMTNSCSIPGCGAVFQLTPPTTEGGAWTETVLHSFPSRTTDGAIPSGGLILSKNGVFFGVTHSSGTPGVGTVYALTK